MITYEGKICPPPEGFIAIVVAKFNRSITERLLDGALEKLKSNGVREQDIQVSRVPGAFEIPLVARKFAEHPECLAVICLGAVIKGETSHDEHINRAVSLELAKTATTTETPVIFGLLTCNTVAQAEARSGKKVQSRDKALDPTAGNKGAEAAEAALEMIDLLTELPETDQMGVEMLSNFMREFGSEGFDRDFTVSPRELLEEDFEDEEDYYIPPPKKKVKKAAPKKRKKS